MFLLSVWFDWLIAVTNWCRCLVDCYTLTLQGATVSDTSFWCRRRSHSTLCWRARRADRTSHPLATVCRIGLTRR